MLQPPSPAVVEQAVLNAMNAKSQQILNYLSTYPGNTNPQLLSQWIGGLDQLVWELQSFAPQVAWLQNRGFLQAAQRLNTALRDMQTAREQYVAMFQSGLQMQSNTWRMWQDANTYATANILAATNYSNAVFERNTQDMFDVMENRCYDCQRLINVPGGGYCLNCARQRGLVY